MTSVFQNILNFIVYKPARAFFDFSAPNKIKVSKTRLGLWDVFQIVIVFLFLYFLGRYNFVLFHILVELISVVIAVGIFIVAWNSRRFLDSNFLLIVGIAYLFIGATDFMHIISQHPELSLIGNFNDNLSQQLRITGRLLEAITFVLALLMINRKPVAENVFLTYLSVFSFLMFSIFSWKIFPDALAANSSYTIFKKFADYAIMLTLVAALVLMHKRKNKFEAGTVQLLSLSILFQVLSVALHTPYNGIYTATNVLGHSFRFVSFFFLYKAVIQNGLMYPYKTIFRNLVRKHRELKIARDNLENKVKERTAELHEANLMLKKDKEHLIESYRYMGVNNRKISILLDLHRNSLRRNKNGIVHYVLTTVLNFSRAGACYLHFYDTELRTLHLISAINLSPQQKKIIRTVAVKSSKFLQKVTKKPALIEGECKNHRIVVFDLNGQFKYFMFIPLMGGGKLLGTIFLGFKDKKTMNTNDDLDFFDLFSLHAAQALRNVKALK